MSKNKSNTESSALSADETGNLSENMTDDGSHIQQQDKNFIEDASLIDHSLLYNLDQIPHDSELFYSQQQQFENQLLKQQIATDVSLDNSSQLSGSIRASVGSFEQSAASIGEQQPSIWSGLNNVSFSSSESTKEFVMLIDSIYSLSPMSHIIIYFQHFLISHGAFRNTLQIIRYLS